MELGSEEEKQEEELGWLLGISKKTSLNVLRTHRYLSLLVPRLCKDEEVPREL